MATVAPTVVRQLSGWSLLADLTSRLSARGAAVIVGGVVISNAALVLLRYLLLTLFNPRR
jgi:hypothetical protein